MKSDLKLKTWAYGCIPESWEVKRIEEYTNIVTDYVSNGSFASLAENVQYKKTPDEAVLIRLVDYNNDFKGDFVFIDAHAYEFLSKSKLFGGESASAAQKQIKESSNQQKQNVGIQLYSLRKQVMELFEEKEYNSIFWDVEILFSKEISAKFQSLAIKQAELEKTQSFISEWESILQCENLDEYMKYQQLSNAIEQSPLDTERLYEDLYTFCDLHQYRYKDEASNETEILNYRDLSMKSIELNRETSALHTSLFLKMKKFMKESIGLEN